MSGKMKKVGLTTASVLAGALFLAIVLLAGGMTLGAGRAKAPAGRGQSQGVSQNVPRDSSLSSLLLPTQGNGPFPVVVDIGGVQGIEMLLDRGIAVAHTGGGTASDFNRGYRNANGAVSWLRANGKSVNIDPDRISTIGISKNGNAATGVAVSSGIGTTNFGEPVQIAPGGQRAATDRVCCAVDLWGTTDLMQTHRLQNATTGGAMGMTIAVAMSNSAINYISKDDPPVLLLFPFDPGAHGWMSGHRFDVVYRKAGLESTLLLTGMGKWEDLAADFFVRHLQGRKSPVRVHLVAGGNASVGGPCSGWFTVARFGDLTGDLNVKYVVDGNAKALCKPLAGSVTIPAGRTTAETVVKPLATGAVSVSLVDDKAYEVGANRQARINILSGDPPGVYAVGTQPYAKAPNRKSLITIARWGNTAREITANYTVIGNAVAGTDYQPLPGRITIPAGARSATIEVVPLKYPPRSQPYKSVAVSLESGNGYDFGPYCGAACVVIMGEEGPDVPDMTDPFEGR